MTLPKNPSGISQLVSEFSQLINHNGVNSLKGIYLGTIISSPNPLKLRMDFYPVDLDREEGDFIINDNLVLEIGDRVAVLPVATRDMWFVLCKVNNEIINENARLGYKVGPDFVGLEVNISQNRATQKVALRADLWNNIVGKVSGVIRVLTHIGHYHSYGTINTGAGGGDNHTHPVTIPNTTATNPE